MAKRGTLGVAGTVGLALGTGLTLTLAAAARADERRYQPTSRPG